MCLKMKPFDGSPFNGIINSILPGAGRRISLPVQTRKLAEEPLNRRDDAQLFAARLGVLQG